MGNHNVLLHEDIKHFISFLFVFLRQHISVLPAWVPTEKIYNRVAERFPRDLLFSESTPGNMETTSVSPLSWVVNSLISNGNKAYKFQ